MGVYELKTNKLNTIEMWLTMCITFKMSKSSLRKYCETDLKHIKTGLVQKKNF